MIKSENQAILDAEKNNLPKCEICGDYIWEEEAIYYNDQWCCKECENEFWSNIREDFLEKVE